MLGMEFQIDYEVGDREFTVTCEENEVGAVIDRLIQDLHAEHLNITRLDGHDVDIGGEA
jgi:hypothetical protein